MGDESFTVKHFASKTQEMKKKKKNRPNRSKFLAGCKCFSVPKRFLSSDLTPDTLSGSYSSYALSP